VADAWIRNAIAEAVGAFLLVCAVLLAVEAGVTPRGLIYGFAVAGLVAALGHVSGGHFNPAITLAVLLARKIDVLAAAAYMIAQFIGATLGALVVMLTTDKAVVQAGTPVIAEDLISMGGAIALEAIFTFAIVLVFFGVVVDERAPISAYPFAIGLTIAVGVYATDTWTGGALNPVRGFGPAVISGEWSGLPAWLAGPLIGGVLAWALYTFVIAPSDSGRGGSGASRRRDRYPQPVPPPGPSLLP
jgi:MIP family channel proteins